MSMISLEPSLDFVTSVICTSAVNPNSLSTTVTKVMLKYYGTKWMYATINVGKQFAGTVPIVSLVYQTGTPVTNTINISAEQVKDDGETIIWAYGAGFISDHVLYAMIDCRIE